MAKKSSQKLQFNTLKETEEMTDKIKQTDMSVVVRQMREHEIAHFLDDLISKIVETSENTDRSGEQVANTKDLLKELHKSSELFKRIDNINIFQCLDRNLRVNLQASEEDAILKDPLILDGREENCVEDLMESMIKKVENEERQSRSKIIESTNNTELGFIFTNEQFMGEEIIKEMKRVQKIEEIVKDLVKEVLQRLDNNCLILSNSKSVKKLEIPIKILDKSNQQNLSKTAQQSVDGINEQPNILIDCVQPKDISTVCLRQSNVLTDSSNQPDLQKANQLPKSLQQGITSTGCLKQEKIPAASSQQSVGYVQHASTSTSSQLVNTSGDYLNQTCTQTPSSQQKRASRNPLKQPNTPEHSFTQVIENDNFLKETIERACNVFEYRTNTHQKTRRAVSLIKTINERSRQSDKQGMDNLQEIQNMIEMVDCVGDLNEYLQMDIRKIFLEQRELKRISRYVCEHLYTIIYCRSEKFIQEEAVAVIKIGLNILHEIQFVRKQMGKLFRDYLFTQRSFLIHSLKFTSIPYELIIGDNRWNWLVNKVKGSVIGMCGNILNTEEMDDFHDSMLPYYKQIACHVEEFTELVVLLDHKRDTKMDDEN